MYILSVAVPHQPLDKTVMSIMLKLAHSVRCLIVAYDSAAADSRGKGYCKPPIASYHKRLAQSVKVFASVSHCQWPEKTEVRETAVSIFATKLMSAAERGASVIQ